MNGFEVNKVFGAVTGTLAAFLAIQIVSEKIFDHGPSFGPEPELAFSVAVQSSGGEPEPEVSLAELLAAATVQDGERVWGRCQACHDLVEDKQGPHLGDVMGREIGSVDGFGYSGALASAEGVWDFETMDAFLARPDDVADGTSMSFALRNEEQRAAVIVYLNAQLDTPLELPPIPVVEEVPVEGDAEAMGDEMTAPEEDAAPAE